MRILTMAEKELKWESIPLVSKEMNLSLTLSSGQAFRWLQVGTEEEEWCGAIGDRLFILRHHGDELQYQVVTTPTSNDQSEDRHVLEDYFRLDFDLNDLYTQWSVDKNFKEKASLCHGIRLLRQPTLEALIAFICSSNNNISRISGMLSSFSAAYGHHLGEVKGHQFYSFPTIQSLVGVVNESALRDMGFGYRARYVMESILEIERRGGDIWFISLRQQPYKEAWSQLQQLTGVGAKVSDCVCLMGLGHMEAVPVDVHVWRLAQRDYNLEKSSTNLTSSAYMRVGDKFRQVFGATAGWAQAVLFTSELQYQKKKSEIESRGKRKKKSENPQTTKRRKKSL